MSIAERLDEHGKGAWIALMVGSFIVFWPLGLFILGYMMWSGRMGCWTKSGVAKQGGGNWASKAPGRWYTPSHRSSGNKAFDEYREATLRRLEEEQEEFAEYMERLRQARDKEEFERFMAERRSVKDVDISVSDEPEDKKPGKKGK